MRQLWRDVMGHPFSAALFLVWWLALWGVHWYLNWFSGIPPIGVLLHLLAATVAGGLVGCWRAPELGGWFAGRGHLAEGPLAAVLVIELQIAFTFCLNAVDRLSHGQSAAVSAWLGGWVLAWLEWAIVLGAVAVVLGRIGAYAGAMLTRVDRAIP